MQQIPTHLLEPTQYAVSSYIGSSFTFPDKTFEPAKPLQSTSELVQDMGTDCIDT